MKLFTQKYINKIEVTNKFLVDNINFSIFDFIKNNYKTNPIMLIFEKIINDDFDIESINYLKEKLGDMKRFRDNRSIEEYACDLLLGWVVEDTVVYLLKISGYNCEIISKDKDRVFLEIPSSSADIIIHMNNGVDLLIELVVDNTGFWRKNKIIHLREQKYERLMKQDGILLGLDFKNKLFFISKINDIDLNRKIERYNLYGYKPATELSLKNITYYKFSHLGDKLINSLN